MLISSGKKRKNSEIDLGVDYNGLRICYLKFHGKDFLFPAQKVKYGEIKKLRGTHFCIPVFGNPPEKSPLYGKIPQHGFLRDMRFHTNRLNESSMDSYFDIPQTEGYPWKIKGDILVCCRDNVLAMKISLYRIWDCPQDTPAPINIGFHPYWMNKSGVFVSTNGFSGKLDRLIVPAFHTRYLGPVEIKLKDIGSVVMEMRGNCLRKPEIVMWTDHDSFSCVELVVANTKNFDTPKGINLEKGEEIQIEFLLTFGE